MPKPTRTPPTLPSQFHTLPTTTEQVFSKYSTERSDCGSFKNGGDLGLFGPGEMQKQFEDGTSATPVPRPPDPNPNPDPGPGPGPSPNTDPNPNPNPNQIGKMSGIVLSDSGYHLIFRYA